MAKMMSKMVRDGDENYAAKKEKKMRVMDRKQQLSMKTAGIASALKKSEKGKVKMMKVKAKGKKSGLVK